MKEERMKKQNVKAETAATNTTTTAAANTAEITAAHEAKIAELTADLQRTRADFENYRKQMDAQKAQAALYARQSTASSLLPLIDDMSRAIAMTPELKPLEKTLEKTLKELKLEVIDSNPGTVFNPDLHDAVSMEDGEGSTEVILETLRPGYLYDSAVIRPAMVKVGTK